MSKKVYPPSQRTDEVPFFRNEDPDERTPEEWMKDFEMRTLVKRAKKKIRNGHLWYPN